MGRNARSKRVSESEAQHGQDGSNESVQKGSRFDGSVGAVGNQGNIGASAGIVEGDQVGEQRLVAGNENQAVQGKTIFRLADFKIMGD